MPYAPALQKLGLTYPKTTLTHTSMVVGYKACKLMASQIQARTWMDALKYIGYANTQRERNFQHIWDAASLSLCRKI